MNKSRLLVGVLLVALMALFAPASRAQAGPNCQAAGSTINCNVIVVGSSAIFASAALAAISPDPTRGNAALCGNRFWTGAAFGRDARTTLTNPNLGYEPATVWIAWDNDATPTIICAYLSVGSITGQRLFYGQGAGASGPANNGQLILPFGTGTNSACGTPGANRVPFIWDTATAGLPPAIYNALEGTTGTFCPAPGTPVNFTTASTDVGPADALFVVNERKLAQDRNSSAAFPADSKDGLGYGQPSCLNGAQEGFLSSYTPTLAQSACYTYVSGQPDPISGTLIPSSQIADEGVLAMIPIINITNIASGGFGDLFNNRSFNGVLSRGVAAGYALSPYGTATLTRDLYLGRNASSIPVAVVHYLVNEAQSGAYATWEWQVVRNSETALGGGGLSQETNVCGPSQAAFGCPYNWPGNNAAACPTQTNGLTNGTFPATSTCSNYMSWGVNGFNALKTRVLGTEEMVGVSNISCASLGGSCNIIDTFGYAFWGLGAFGGMSNVRYLQLDGVDALYIGWSASNGGNNGAFPVTIGGSAGQGKSSKPGPAPVGGCAGYYNGNGTTIQAFACNSWPYPTFTNIASGSYRVWSTNRVVWYLPSGSTTLSPNWTVLNAPAFWLSTADQAAPVVGSPGHGTIPDFMPFRYCASAAACPSGSVPTLTYPMNAFRSHYSVPSWGIGSPNNGISGSGYTAASVAGENGGDVEGSIVSVQAEAESIGFFSDSFLSWIQ